MEDEKLTVPYIVYEGAMARSERHLKRLVIALVISILMIVVSNLTWLYMWNSYEYIGNSSEISLETDDGGNANYIGNDGDITNGEDNSEESNPIPKEKER